MNVTTLTTFLDVHGTTWTVNERIISATSPDGTSVTIVTADAGPGTERRTAELTSTRTGYKVRFLDGND